MLRKILIIFGTLVLLLLMNVNALTMPSAHASSRSNLRPYAVNCKGLGSFDGYNSCDGLDSGSTSCNRDQVQRDITYLHSALYPYPTIGYVRLYFSANCDSMWANIHDSRGTSSSETESAHADRSASKGRGLVQESGRGQGVMGLIETLL